MATIEQLRRELKNDKALRACASKFGLVADPTRMKICWLLCHHRELSVSDIAEILGVSVSVVSHSLKKLRQHNVVCAERRHRQVFYRLTDTAFGRVLKTSVATL